MELKAKGTISVRIARDAGDNSSCEFKIAFTPDTAHSFSSAGTHFALFISTEIDTADLPARADLAARMYKLSKSGSLNLATDTDWSELALVATHKSLVEIEVRTNSQGGNPVIRAVTIPAPLQSR